MGDRIDLAAIRQRHATFGVSLADGLLYSAGHDAHADRGVLLAEVDRLRNALDAIRAIGERNPNGSPTAMAGILGVVGDALGDAGKLSSVLARLAEVDRLTAENDVLRVDHDGADPKWCAHCRDVQASTVHGPVFLGGEVQP